LRVFVDACAVCGENGELVGVLQCNKWFLKKTIDSGRAWMKRRDCEMADAT
jgi:hypothetical protein